MATEAKARAQQPVQQRGHPATPNRASLRLATSHDGPLAAIARRVHTEFTFDALEALLGTTRSALGRTIRMSPHLALDYGTHVEQPKRLVHSPGGQGVACSSRCSNPPAVIRPVESVIGPRPAVTTSLNHRANEFTPRGHSPVVGCYQQSSKNTDLPLCSLLWPHLSAMRLTSPRPRPSSAW